MAVLKRIGSHAQPCKLVWCRRAACKRQPVAKKPAWLRRSLAKDLTGQVTG